MDSVGPPGSSSWWLALRDLFIRGGGVFSPAGSSPAEGGASDFTLLVAVFFRAVVFFPAARDEEARRGLFVGAGVSGLSALAFSASVVDGAPASVASASPLDGSDAFWDGSFAELSLVSLAREGRRREVDLVARFRAVRDSHYQLT